MQKTGKNGIRLAIIAGLMGSALMPIQAFAQDNGNGGLTDIVVTAQRREQNLQDVPIAITALSQETLQANRVTTVSDLSGLAPGVTVRPSAGGVGVPTFTIRGAVSYGVVPGSDKQVSMYLDGVYISSPRGSIFDLPDIQRLEMLRGPQGTLFGRNATAGAMSITTRDPTGEPAVKAVFTVGNYDQYRMRLSADLPQVGPFSAYVSYVHNYKRGDIRNLGAGQVWDRTNSPKGGIGTSPKYLGTRDSDSYFAALKFDAGGRFTSVYKFDLNKSENTPEGTALIGYNANYPLIGNLIGSVINSQPTPVPFAADGKRPDSVTNSWATPVHQKVFGHSLTSNLDLGGGMSLKNIAAYRKATLFSAAPIDGVGALKFTAQSVVPYATFAAFSANPSLALATPAVQAATIGAYAAGLAPLVGQPIVFFGSSSNVKSKQWSDELQFNYNSDFLTLTVGGLWFHGNDLSGSLPGVAATSNFAIIPNGKLPVAGQGVAYNKATSIAAYTQAEFHVTPQLDVILGGRITKDKKSGHFDVGLPGAINAISFSYKKTKPSYLIGVNYKPTDDILVYGKYSTAFVSGGSVAGIAFKPETAASWEAGIKADLFDKHLRSNLSVFYVTYKNFQTAQGGSNFPAGTFPNQNVISTLVYPQGGPVKAKGFEFESTARLFHGLTAGGSLSYTKTTFKDVDPILVNSTGGEYLPTLRPDWTGGLWGQYETDPLVGDARLSFRIDGNWRSKMWLDSNRHRGLAAFEGASSVDARWIVNGRVALSDIQFGNGPKMELAAWGRNLFDDKSLTFALIPNGILAQGTFEAARTYGVDLTVAF